MSPRELIRAPKEVTYVNGSALMELARQRRCELLRDASRARLIRSARSRQLLVRRRFSEGLIAVGHFLVRAGRRSAE